MTVAGALGFSLLVLAGLLVLLSAAVAGQRGRRLRFDRRRQAIVEPLRPALLQLAAGEPEDAARALEQLAGLDARRWEAIEPTLESLLLKVRGETKASVVGLLERRGSLAQALARTRSRSVVQRAHGAEVLGAAGRQSALPDLVRMLSDDEPEVRQVAARALGRIRAPGAAEPLLATLSAQRAVPPRIVATAILRIGVGAHPALDAALRHGDALQRSVAAEIAGLSGAFTAVPTLEGLLAGDPEPEVRIRSARALGRIGAGHVVDELLQVVEEDQPVALRIVATRALGDLGDDRAVPRLTQLATDPQYRVAANAATALTRCGVAGLRALRRLANAPDGAHARDALATAALRGVGYPGDAIDDLDRDAALVDDGRSARP